MVKLVHIGEADFRAEAHLMRASSVGNVVGDVVGDVVAAVGIGHPHTVKTGNLELRCSQQGQGRAHMQPKRPRLEGVIVIGKDLIEVVRSHQHLVGQARRKR